MSPCRRGSAAMGGIDQEEAKKIEKKGLRNRKGFSGNDGHPGHFLSLATGCVGKERTYRKGVSMDNRYSLASFAFFAAAAQESFCVCTVRPEMQVKGRPTGQQAEAKVRH